MLAERLRLVGQDEMVVQSWQRRALVSEPRGEVGHVGHDEGMAGPAARRSLPYHIEETCTTGRCLLFSSASVSVLLLQAIAACFAPTKQAGRLMDDVGRAGCERIVRGL